MKQDKPLTKLDEIRESKRKKRNRPGKQVLRRTTVLLIIFGALFVRAGFQLFDLQYVRADEFERMAINQQTREVDIPAARGTIYDTNGKLLAQSATAYTVFISPKELITYEEDKTFIARSLADLWGEAGNSYEQIIPKWDKTTSWYEKVAVRLEPELTAKVRSFIAENKLKSVHIAEDSKRYYPARSLASQLLGFVGDENTGLSGLEAYYESTLRGIGGSTVRATNAAGTDMIDLQYENYYDAADGNAIAITIDSTLQYYLEKHLSRAIIDNKVKNGAMGIMMDVNTGAVLAAATLPDFDPNKFSDSSIIPEETITRYEGTLTDKEREAGVSAQTKALQALWKSRTFSDTYEPGSTFKIITLAAALDAGVISVNDTFFCGGSYSLPGDPDVRHCWKHSGHGSQTLYEAAQHSCNVAFIQIGMKLGAKGFYDYIKALGLQDKTGIDFIGEENGLWWPESDFYASNSSLASASFGQTFNITPIQLITAVSAIANGGNLMKPYLLKNITASDGTILKENKPTVVRQAVSEEVSVLVRDILETVVSAPSGTGKNARVAGYRVAGKTGTGEKIGQASNEYVVSFIGFAPADDPKIAVLVLLDSPDRTAGNAVSGGAMAAPVVSSVLADSLDYLGIPPNFTSEEISVTMPNAKGMNISEANAKIQGLGITARIYGNGSTVTDQVPAVNEELDPGSQVILYTESGKPSELVEVPNIFGLTYTRARGELEAIGLFIKTVGVNPDGAKSTIITARQSFDPGTEVAYGTVVIVTLIDNDPNVLEGRG
ncbi:MAG: PASTA domain-containing protein [Oscillospiraceae bacterium]|jgi:stage V sporulation protein D (sporulation-specific penicillin-binding protein)|nr:PASTA domain-containing protein [Oscillospiraceae bacterium]